MRPRTMASNMWLVCISLLLFASTSLADEIWNENEGLSTFQEFLVSLPADERTLVEGMFSTADDEPALATRSCPLKCSKTCYDPVDHQCCNGVLIHEYFSCPSCSQTKKCGQRCMPKTGYQCCYDKVIPSAWKCCAHHCSGNCYNAVTQKCCDNAIIPRNKTCCIKPSEFCGNNCYNSTVAQCCHNRVIDIDETCCKRKERACGKACYNRKTHKCCPDGNQITPSGQPCCKQDEKACSKVCYKTKSQQCCHKVVMDSKRTCCRPKQSACGKRCYNPKTHICCRHGNRILRSGQPCCKLDERACLKVCYKTKSQQCCHNRVMDKAKTCCSRRKRPCGKVCFNPGTHFCCSNRKVLVRGQKCCRPGDKRCGKRKITREIWAKHIGCYRDHGNRAIPPLDGHDRLLKGNYISRKHAIEKCAMAAARRGWKFFAVQNQGWCASSATAGKTYNKYGPYNTCRNGKGGPWGNDVYELQGTAAQKTTSKEICVFPFIYKGATYNSCTAKDRARPWCAVTPNYDEDKLRGDCVTRTVHITRKITAYSIGCFKDTANRAMPYLEGKDRLLNGNYRFRKYAIEKCALAAAKRGWKYFAVQHQGQCFSGPRAGHTYSKWGSSNKCRHGKGGPMANDVYILEGRAAKKTTGGEICVFPFMYNGVRYNGCTNRDHNRPWCAVTPNFNADRLRGDCRITCPRFQKLCGTRCFDPRFGKRCCSGNRIKWFRCSSWGSWGR